MRIPMIRATCAQVTRAAPGQASPPRRSHRRRSLHGRLRLARDITLAAVRSALQLAAFGALLLPVFRHTGLAGAIG